MIVGVELIAGYGCLCQIVRLFSAFDDHAFLFLGLCVFVEYYDFVLWMWMRKVVLILAMDISFPGAIVVGECCLDWVLPHGLTIIICNLPYKKESLEFANLVLQLMVDVRLK